MRSVLEIGAGLGVTGMAAALVAEQVPTRSTPYVLYRLTFYIQVVLTDFNPEVLHNLDQHIRLNWCVAHLNAISSRH